MIQLPKPRTGQAVSFSARTHRALAQAVEAASRAQSSHRSPFTTPRDYGLVFVRNDTGADLDAHQAVRLGDAVWNPADDESQFHLIPAFEGLAPNEDQPFAITAQPIRANTFGRAVASGVVPCEVTGSGPPDHRWAELVGSDPAVLTSTAEPTGCEILWRAEGTGAQWALVRLGTSGDDSGCECPNTWHLSAHGAITGGTFALPFTLGTGGGGTTEIIEVPWSATAAELQTLLRSHSLVETPSEVVCTLGPLPGREIHITLTGSLAGYTTAFNTPDSTLLEGDPGAQVRLGTFRPVSE